MLVAVRVGDGGKLVKVALDIESSGKSQELFRTWISGV